MIFSAIPCLCPWVITDTLTSLQMCFTVNVNLVKEELENRYGRGFIDHERYRPSYYYHAFALPELPVVTSERITLARWGLIPEWVKNEAQASEIRMKTFNARSETIDRKPSFAGSFLKRRCIVPVAGFFEWQHTSSGKIPWYITSATDEILSLGGLWNEWHATPGGDVVNTFSIVTTGANQMMAEIHNSGRRMPLILSGAAVDKWIDRHARSDEVAGLMVPAPEASLRGHTISQLIGRRDADRNRAELINPHNYNNYGTLFD